MANMRIDESSAQNVSADGSHSQTAADPQLSADLGHDGGHEHIEDRLEWARVGFVALILVLCWLLTIPRVAGIDLLAQMADERIHSVGLDVLLEAPDPLDDRRSGHSVPRAPHEEFENPILGGRKVQRRAGA